MESFSLGGISWVCDMQSLETPGQWLLYKSQRHLCSGMELERLTLHSINSGLYQLRQYFKNNLWEPFDMWVKCHLRLVDIRIGLLVFYSTVTWFQYVVPRANPVGMTLLQNYTIWDTIPRISCTWIMELGYVFCASCSSSASIIVSIIPLNTCIAIWDL